MTHDTFDNTCLRHPNTLSNLRCGRCNDLICPECMLQSPVGARCSDCATIGQAPIFRATGAEFTATIGLAVGGAIVFGIIYGLIAWVLWQLPLTLQIGYVAASMVIALAGAPLGEFVRRAGKNKLDPRYKIIAAAMMFLVWVVGIIVSSGLGVWSGIFYNIIGYIGLGVGIYVAMNRVRS